MRVLFCGYWFPESPPALAACLPDVEILSCPVAQVLETGRDVDVIIPLMHRLESELITTTRAGLIQQFGVGLEGVDIALASSRGILVCNVPADISKNGDATAEHAVFLMMGVARRLDECRRSFEEGGWGTPIGFALSESVALIVGLGRVGSALAAKLRGLGVTVHAVRRTPDPPREADLGIARAGEPKDLVDMARDADFIVSAVALTEDTRDLFNRKLFEAMKPTAFFINVSRGPVVNENDLMEALNTGSISGAGLDVFATEPVDASHALLQMENVVATPHIAGVTRQSYREMARVVAENITRFGAGKPPLHCANLEEASKRA